MIEPRLDPYLDLCRHCDRQIVKGNGPRGEHLMIDADPGPEKGNLVLDIRRGVLFVSPPVTAGQAAGMRTAGHRLYVDHALTCPRAGEWHKVKDHGKATRRYRTRR